jgi:hypothetical protein
MRANTGGFIDPLERKCCRGSDFGDVNAAAAPAVLCVLGTQRNYPGVQVSPARYRIQNLSTPPKKRHR